MTRTFEETFQGSSVMAIFRGRSVAETLDLAHRVWDLGIRVVEVTVQTDADFDALVATASEARRRGLVVGAGTVITPDKLRRAVASGAQFTVSPNLSLEVIEAARAADVPHLPGVATGSEVHVALDAGCTWLKAFPAVSLGPHWFSAMRGPFPSARLVATGGITVGEIDNYLSAGATVVGLGSALTDPGSAQALSQVIEWQSTGPRGDAARTPEISN